MELIQSRFFQQYTGICPNSDPISIFPHKLVYNIASVHERVKINTQCKKKKEKAMKQQEKIVATRKKRKGVFSALDIYETAE